MLLGTLYSNMHTQADCFCTSILLFAVDILWERIFTKSVKKGNDKVLLSLVVSIIVSGIEKWNLQKNLNVSYNFGLRVNKQKCKKSIKRMKRRENNE